MATPPGPAGFPRPEEIPERVGTRVPSESFDSPAERFRRVSGRFSDRVAEVPDAAWDNPAPCDGWLARDVVRHMVEWMPSFLTRIEVHLGQGPSVDDNPRAAWAHVADGIQGLLDDPHVAARDHDVAPIGKGTLAGIIDRIMVGDVLVHTWDLARAVGLDEALDPGLVHEMLVGLEPMNELLRQSGQYGPKVAVDHGADEQTRLIAFTGRHP